MLRLLLIELNWQCIHLMNIVTKSVDILLPINRFSSPVACSVSDFCVTVARDVADTPLSSATQQSVVRPQAAENNYGECP